MYQGKPILGIEFYHFLEKSKEFTSELGQAVLACGKLEAELIILLEKNDLNGKYKKATLGTLIRRAEKNRIIDEKMIDALRMVSIQRNYITHNIYALFMGQLEETILEKNNLFDSDVDLYVERARQLKENINGIAEILKNENNH